VRFFFDNNLPRRLAAAMGMLAEFDGDEIRHLQDRHRPDAPDTEWLESLGHEREWAVITCDAVNETKLERQAIVERSR